MQSLLKKVITTILQSQVKRLVANHELKVVGITGSVGKTSTKYAVSHVLERAYKTLSGKGNYNSEIGMPLSLFEEQVLSTVRDVWSWLGILVRNECKIYGTYPYQIAVLEMGADHPGDIASFMSYIKPDIGIVTAVAPSHVEGFGSVENILREKWLLAKNSDQAIINFDFDILQQHARQDSDVKAVSYATTKQADYCVVNQLLDSSLGERRFEVQLPDGQIEVFSTRLLAKHSLPALLAAIIVGVQLGVSMQVIKQAIKEVESPPGRLRIYRGINDSSLIDDTYNANSTSMIAALDFLGEVSGGRKVAVLGSINELGTMSCSEHELVGRHCSDLDHLVTIGDDAKNFLVPAAIKAGLSPEKITSHESPVAAGLQVRDVIKPGDWVLFKGSQNQVFAEEALKQVLESQGDIPDLVRQSNYWLGKKHAQFPDISL